MIQLRHLTPDQELMCVDLDTVLPGILPDSVYLTPGFASAPLIDVEAEDLANTDTFVRAMIDAPDRYRPVSGTIEAGVVLTGALRMLIAQEENALTEAFTLAKVPISPLTMLYARCLPQLAAGIRELGLAAAPTAAVAGLLVHPAVYYGASDPQLTTAEFMEMLSIPGGQGRPMDLTDPAQARMLELFNDAAARRPFTARGLPEALPLLGFMAWQPAYADADTSEFVRILHQIDHGLIERPGEGVPDTGSRGSGAAARPAPADPVVRRGLLEAQPTGGASSGERVAAHGQHPQGMDPLRRGAGDGKWLDCSPRRGGVR